MIYNDSDDLRLKLGRHIVDALYNSSRQTVSWHSASATNYVKSNTELEIRDRGKIWSDTGILRPFTLSYEGSSQKLRNQHPANRGDHSRTLGCSSRLARIYSVQRNLILIHEY